MRIGDQRSAARLAAQAPLGPGYPRLFFKYSFLFDNVCSPNTPIPADVAKEAKDREPEFTALWEKDAPIVFGQLFAEFGKGMSRKELTATVSACPVGGSISDPLVINVAP